jgi:hypothetical protein
MCRFFEIAVTRGSKAKYRKNKKKKKYFKKINSQKIFGFVQLLPFEHPAYLDSVKCQKTLFRPFEVTPRTKYRK